MGGSIGHLRAVDSASSVQRRTMETASRGEGDAKGMIIVPLTVIKHGVDTIYDFSFISYSPTDSILPLTGFLLSLLSSQKNSASLPATRSPPSPSGSSSSLVAHHGVVPLMTPHCLCFCVHPLM